MDQRNIVVLKEGVMEDIDLERWLNELAHKYVAIISLAALHCWHPPILCELQTKYELIRYGSAQAMFFGDDEQFVRKPRHRSAFFTSAGLLKFSKMIEIVKMKLDEFVKKDQSLL